jgi:hypothetical protein
MKEYHYEDSLSFETFICRMRNCRQNDVFEAHKEIFKQLMIKERKGKLILDDRPFPVMLEEIKNYMLNATQVYIDNQKNDLLKAFILSIRGEIRHATDSTQLLSICEEVLHTVKQYNKGKSGE